MKNISHFLFLLLVLFMGTGSASSCTAFSPTEKEIITIDPESQIIYDKIEQLSLTKAAAKQYLNMYKIPMEYAYAVSDPEFIKLHQEAETLRAELMALGASPDAEILSELSLADLPDDAFDIWGIYQEVHTSSGTYDTYTVLIQDTAYGNILSSCLSHNSAPGLEIFSACDSSVQNILAENLPNVALVSRAYASQQNGGIPSVTETVPDTSEQPQQNAPQAARGHTKSYKIYCDISPCMIFMFVRDSSDGVWQHTFTTNHLAIAETHDRFFVYWANRMQNTWNDEREYRCIEYPERYVYRYTDAITAYRSGTAFHTDLINAYEVIAITPTETAHIFTLDAICPTTRDALFQLAQ